MSKSYCQGTTKAGKGCRNVSRDYCHLRKPKDVSVPTSVPTLASTGAPTVVHLKRKGGKVVQDCDTYIGRACNMGGWRLPKSKWCNPYTVKEHGRDTALTKYREHVLSFPDLKAQLEELRGQRLGCFCAPDPCHGDILVTLYRELVEEN